MENATKPASGKVLLFVETLDIGGQEKLLVQLAKTLVGRSFCVAVCTLRRGGVLAAELKSNGVPVMSLGVDEGLSLSGMFRLWKLIRRNQFAVIHSHNSATHFYASLAHCFTKTRHINTRHGHAPQTIRGWIRDFVSFSLSDAVTAVSTPVAEELRSAFPLYESKISLVENGVDLSAYRRSSTSSGLEHGEPLIGHIGRLEPVKNQQLLLTAFSRFATNHPSARLEIVGDGSLIEQLQSRADELQLRDRISILGYRADVPELVRRYSWLAFSSVSEGMPLAAIEALASGVPITSTPVGDLSALIRETDIGFLSEGFDPDAVVMSWESMMSAIAANPDELRDRCREIAESRYSEDQMVSRYISLYEPEP